MGFDHHRALSEEGIELSGHGSALLNLAIKGVSARSAISVNR
jgi:hypothetical protein